MWCYNLNLSSKNKNVQALSNHKWFLTNEKLFQDDSAVHQLKYLDPPLAIALVSSI